MNSVKSIMIVGVGGQGTLLASRLIGEVLVSAGFDVKVSEVHGMSQRGGSVVTYVRYGKEVSSPLIDLGEADIILAFESLEAARYLPYLKKGGVIIMSDQRIDPMPVITGGDVYPENIAAKLKGMGARLVECAALPLAEEAGSARAVNVVLIGVMSRFMDFPKSDWEKAISAVVPERFREMNLKAFTLSERIA